MLKEKNELAIVLEFKKKSSFKRYLFLVFIALVFAILLDCIVNRYAETTSIGFVFVIACWLYHIYFNKLNSGKIEIHTDSFIINNGNQKKVIPYNQIKKISSRYYLNGDEGDFTIQLLNNKKIRISVLLLKANLLIERIYNKTNAINKEEYEKIIKYFGMSPRDQTALPQIFSTGRSAGLIFKTSFSNSLGGMYPKLE